MKPLKWENLEAENLAKWLRLKDYRFSHIANESGLPPKVAMLSAMRKKRMWVSKGVPDYMIVLKRWALLFIELKRPRPILKNWKLWSSPSVISEEQKEWIETLSRIDNIDAVIAYGSEEARNIIEIIEHK